MLEAALLDIKPGQKAAFESAIAKARPLIEASPGFQRMEIRSCVENTSRYLLLVWWSRLEDHTEGFRTSDRYAKWRELLHHFYDPFPTVQHFHEPL